MIQVKKTLRLDFKMCSSQFSFGVPIFKNVGTKGKTKKLTNDSGDSDVSVTEKRDKSTKSFRSSYEKLPDDTPWSRGVSKNTNKTETLLKPPGKSSFGSDLFRRDRSPIGRDSDLNKSGVLPRKTNDSDDEIGLSTATKVNVPHGKIHILTRYLVFQIVNHFRDYHKCIAVGN